MYPLLLITSISITIRAGPIFTAPPTPDRTWGITGSHKGRSAWLPTWCRLRCPKYLHRYSRNTRVLSPWWNRSVSLWVQGQSAKSRICRRCSAQRTSRCRESEILWISRIAGLLSILQISSLWRPPQSDFRWTAKCSVAVESSQKVSISS